MKDGEKYFTNQFHAKDQSLANFQEAFLTTEDGECYEIGESMVKRKCIEAVRRDFNQGIHDPDLRSLCQKTECLTENNKLCKFPFRFKGRLYDTCITLESEDPWCSLKTDLKQNHVESKGSRGKCAATCSIQNCPVGFLNINGTCFHLSARTYSDTVLDNRQAEEICTNLGSRLYEPRDFNSFERLKSNLGSFLQPLDKSFFERYKSTDSYLAIGAKTKLLTPQLVVEYNGGSRAYMIEKKIIEQGAIQSFTGFDITSNAETGCIHLDANGALNVEFCSEYIGTGSRLLGYICEAKEQTTIEGADPDKACHFPFKLIGDSLWKNSCMFNETDGTSICATEVDEAGLMIPDKWGTCTDEREIPYRGMGSGEKCAIPYLYDRIWYDSCKLEPEQELWCPTKLNPTRLFDASTDEIGYCTEFMRPSLFSCSENYELVNGTCIRVSPYAESFDDAASMCDKEGAYLLTIPDHHLIPHVVHYIRTISKRRVQFEVAYSPDLSSYWIGGTARDLKWSWMSNGKNLSVYSDWQDGQENKGCVEFVCTDNYALTVNAEKRYTWIAADKSIAKPYICQSRCDIGYKWFPNVKKCLKLYDSINSATLLSAELTCATDNARIVDLRQCKEFNLLAADIWKITKSSFTEFWLGYFSGNFDNYKARRISESERLAKKSISSLGYLAVQGCGWSLPTDFSKSHSGFLKFTGAATNIADAQMFFEEIQLSTSASKKGFICEREKDWSCQTNRTLYQEECYIIQDIPKSFTEAIIHCAVSIEFLFQPATDLHKTFLGFYVLENSIESLLWTGYRRHVKNSSGVLDIYFEMSNNEETNIDFTGLSGK